MEKLEIVISDIEKELSESKRWMGKNLIDKEVMLDLIAKLRIALPECIAKANQVLSDSDAIRQRAKEEYRRTIEQAEEKAGFLVSNDEITFKAEKMAADVLKSTEYQTQQMLLDTKQRIDNLLSLTEKALLDQINFVRNNREALRGELIKQENIINSVSNTSSQAFLQKINEEPSSFAVQAAPVHAAPMQGTHRGSINDPNHPLYMPKQ